MWAEGKISRRDFMASAAAQGLTAVSSTVRTMPLFSPLAKGMAGGEY
jgi:hypothetical protein